MGGKYLPAANEDGPVSARAGHGRGATDLLRPSRDVQVDAGVFLQVAYDFEEVVSVRIAFRPNIRIKLFGGVPILSLRAVKPMVTLI